ncbi:MAG TPA: hypothetical protein EYP85_09320 [Armatimonadetes bacterium]|nr:hypothetical protein [Armatimonadota bacterium]
MGTPVKIGVIGAGSAVFSLNLLRELCLTEGLHGSLISFHPSYPPRICRATSKRPRILGSSSRLCM